MNKHTPGPWHVLDSDIYECPGIEAKGVSIVVFGEVLKEDELLGVQGHTVEECHANARLIAAAPCMYKAGKEALELIERIIEGKEWGAIEEYAADLRAAIEKAEGVA